MDPTALTEGLVRSPLGAVSLRVLEGECMRQHGWSPQPVQAVADFVTQMTTDDLVEAILGTSTSANPWSGASEEVTEAVTDAPARRPVAEALATAHHDFLTAGMDRGSQVAWGAPALPDPLIRDLTSVYECGEFPWGGLRTHTALPHRHDERFWYAHDGGGGAAEVTEWRVRVRSGARIAEIHSAEDWLGLVRRHATHVSPFRYVRQGLRRVLVSGHNAWDIRPTSIEADGTATVRLIDDSERTGIRGLLMPDWTSVATEFDGVGLSWAGFLLAEGNVVDAGDGWLAVARFWSSEQTVCLNDVFDRLEPSRQVNLP